MAMKKVPLVPVEVEAYYDSAEPYVPATDDWADVAAASKGCKGCHLWHYGTQTVFGEGNLEAPVMMVGEQPGDKEDIEGRPFVGPAGRLLDECLAEAGVDPAKVYTTNAVKHFKWEPKGYRRLHKKPNRAEMAACRPWLDKELELVKPKVIVALGATAAQSLMGPKFKVTEERGKVLDSGLGPKLIATVHPSSILRAIDSDQREMQRQMFIADLQVVAKFMDDL